ncbi:MAG: hypothetical protein O7F73_11250 [Gammaproteobacteria bacterium]|nr:hypothetical protein [Gammaproteobacteria bacterium]
MQAAVRYLIPTAEKPIYLASLGGADAQLSISTEFAEHSVEMHDARQFQPVPDLDREGFALFPQATAIQDFYDY